jgi:hypothetical protein
LSLFHLAVNNGGECHDSFDALVSEVVNSIYSESQNFHDDYAIIFVSKCFA